MTRREMTSSRALGRVFIMAVVLLGLGVVAVYGQPAPESASPQAATTAGPATQSSIDQQGNLPAFAELFYFSPYINGVIAVLSMMALLLFVFFLLTINARAMVPPDFVDEVTKLAIRGKFEAASDLCRANRRIFIASIIQRCMENAQKPTSVIMNIIDAEGKRRADLMWNRISYLADISNVAPMLGLLGTVIGMIKAFFILEEQTGSVASTSLSRGVGEAMATTMFGLIVAILALFFYSIVKTRATATLAEAEAAVHAVSDHIKSTKRAAPAGPPLRPVRRPRRGNDPIGVRDDSDTDEHDL